MVRRKQSLGSEELSTLSPGLCEVVEDAYIEICEADAKSLRISSGNRIVMSDARATLKVRSNDSVAQSCAGFSVGLKGAENLEALHSVSLQRADNWRRRAPTPGSEEVIGSDRALNSEVRTQRTARQRPARPQGTVPEGPHV